MPYTDGSNLAVVRRFYADRMDMTNYETRQGPLSIPALYSMQSRERAFSRTLRRYMPEGLSGAKSLMLDVALAYRRCR